MIQPAGTFGIDRTEKFMKISCDVHLDIPEDGKQPASEKMSMKKAGYGAGSFTMHTQRNTGGLSHDTRSFE